MGKIDWLEEGFHRRRAPRRPQTQPWIENNVPKKEARPDPTDRVIEANLAQLSVGGENGNY